MILGKNKMLAVGLMSMHLGDIPMEIAANCRLFRQTDDGCQELPMADLFARVPTEFCQVALESIDGRDQATQIHILKVKDLEENEAQERRLRELIYQWSEAFRAEELRLGKQANAY